jgi:hypothetical protein
MEQEEIHLRSTMLIAQRLHGSKITPSRSLKMGTCGIIAELRSEPPTMQHSRERERERDGWGSKSDSMLKRAVVVVGERTTNPTSGMPPISLSAANTVSCSRGKVYQHRHISITYHFMCHIVTTLY